MKSFVRTSTMALAAAGLLSALLVLPATADPSQVAVLVNGQVLTFDQPPVEQAGRVFVPMRGVFENLGATVVYDNGTINATGRGHNISLHIGSNQATVDGQTETLDEAPFVIGSRTLIPLRFVAQALGASVDWSQRSNTVRITAGADNGRDSAATSTVPASFALVHRRPEGTIAPGTPSIHADFNQPVRRDTVVVYLDGRDVTSMSTVTGDGIDVTPDHDLHVGPHRIRVVGTTRDGAAFDTGWTIVVQ